MDDELEPLEVVKRLVLQSDLPERMEIVGICESEAKHIAELEAEMEVLRAELRDERIERDFIVDDRNLFEQRCSRVEAERDVLKAENEQLKSSLKISHSLLREVLETSPSKATRDEMVKMIDKFYIEEEK